MVKLYLKIMLPILLTNVNIMGDSTFTFENMLPNAMEIKEYRFVIDLGIGKTKELVVKSIENILIKYSDSIVANEISFNGKGKAYPAVPKNYTKGFFRYLKKRLIFFNNYYSFKFVIDKDCTQLCVWTFRSTHTGAFYKDAKYETKKIIKFLCKNMDGLELLKSFKINGTKFSAIQEN